MQYIDQFVQIALRALRNLLENKIYQYCTELAESNVEESIFILQFVVVFLIAKRQSHN
jgi:hypothetical protein